MFTGRVSSQGLCPNIQGPNGLDWGMYLVVLAAALAGAGPAMRPSWAGEKSGKHNAQNTNRTTHDRKMTRIPLHTNTDVYLGWGLVVAALVCETFLLCPTTYEHPVSAWTFCRFVGRPLCSFSAFTCDKPHLFFDTPSHSLKHRFCRKRLCSNVRVAIQAPNFH